MNLSSVYTKTTKGSRALLQKSKDLSAQAIRLLAMVDGKSNVTELLSALKPVTEQQLQEILTQLESHGYIKTRDELAELPEFNTTASIEVAEISAEEFLLIQSAAEDKDKATQAHEQQQAETRAKAYAEEQRKLDAAALEQQEAERKLLMITDILAKSGNHIDIEKLASNEPAPTMAERKLREEAEYRIRKQKIRQEAKSQAKLESRRKARMDPGFAPTHSSADPVQASAEIEAMAKLVAQSKAQDEHALATAKAEAEAETQVKRAADERALAETKRIAREQAEASAQREAEEKAARQAEEEIRLEAARAQAEAEAKVRHEEKERAQQETHRIAREQAEAHARQAAEEKARMAAERQARLLAEERARAQAKAETRARQEAAEHEQAEAKRIAREQAEIHARQLADIKVRAEAERNARKLAETEIKAQAKILTKQKDDERAFIKAQEKARAKAGRESSNLYQWLGSILGIVRKLFITAALMLVLVVVGLPLVNLNMLRAPLQELTAESIREPVQIKNVHASLWPEPHLTLGEVYIGKLADIKVNSIDVVPTLASWTTDSKILKTIKFDTFTLDQSNFNRPIKWINMANKSGKVKVQQILFTKASVKMNNAELPEFTGNIDLDAAGKFTAARFGNEGHGLDIEITSKKPDAYAITVDVNQWQSPWTSDIVIDEMHVQGLATGDQIKFELIEGKLYGGSIRASMLLNWANGWNANGDFELAKLNLEEFSTSQARAGGLKGKLNAQALFAMHATEPENLVKMPEITANFEIHDGEIKGLDLVRAMQASAKESSSGETRFDKLSGKLMLKDGHSQYSQLRLSYGQFKANGEIDILPEQTISGKINTELITKSRQLQLHFNLSGKIGSPRLN